MYSNFESKPHESGERKKSADIGTYKRTQWRMTRERERKKKYACNTQASRGAD